MKTKNSSSIFIVIAVIFVFLYVILAAKPLSKENQYIPQWKILISKTPAPEHATENSSFFKLGNNTGYFSDDGEILLNTYSEGSSSISDFYYATYNTNADSIPFFDNKGEKKGTITESGFPFFYEDRIYLFSPGGSSFSKCDGDGTVLWSAESVIPLTAFTSKEKFTAAGYADGTVLIFDNETGRLETKFEPGGSDFPVILGLDISEDGKYIATVSGQNRQRFVIAQKESIQPKIIFHTFLDDSVLTRTAVKFCEENMSVYYNSKNQVGIYNLKTNTLSSIPIDFRIIDIQESDSLIFMLGHKASEYSVYIIENTNVLSGSFSFPASSCFIKARNGKLFVGKDTSISCIELAKN